MIYGQAVSSTAAWNPAQQDDIIVLAIMATLQQIDSANSYNLSSQFLIGRQEGCSLRLDNRQVSGTHAEIRWNGSSWVIKDLGSRNGTFIDHHRLESGERIQLRIGMKIAFGDASILFELIDDSPPSARAISDDGQSQDAQHRILILPDPENPVYSVFEDGTGRWWAESHDSKIQVSDQHKLHIGSQTWTLHVPVISENTLGGKAPPRELRNCVLRFQVSGNREHIIMELVYGGKGTVLPARAHNELLLRLAELRLEDQKNSTLSAAEHGWVYIPDLIRELGSNENRLYQHVYRTREQFAGDCQISDGVNIVERRPASRQIRLGISRIEIVPL